MTDRKPPLPERDRTDEEEQEALAWLENLPHDDDSTVGESETVILPVRTPTR
jgi:hypothetical protein